MKGDLVASLRRSGWGIDGGGAEFAAVVGTEGGGSESVVRFGLSEIGADARASHLLDWAVFYRFDFRLLVRSLVLRTLLDCFGQSFIMSMMYSSG